MAQLNVKLGEEQLEALRRYAASRRTTVSWLIRDYVDFLITGGRPITSSTTEAPTAPEMAELAQRGGALNWLHEEPELYSQNDGEPI